MANGIETNFRNPEKLAAEESVTMLLFGFGALSVERPACAGRRQPSRGPRGLMADGTTTTIYGPEDLPIEQVNKAPEQSSACTR